MMKEVFHHHNCVLKVVPTLKSLHVLYALLRDISIFFMLNNETS